MGGGLESRCVGRVYSADGTVHHPHCTHDLRSGSQDHHPSKNSVQKTICCNSTSNAPDDGRMYLKHVELRIHQPSCIKLAFHFISFLITVFVSINMQTNEHRRVMDYHAVYSPRVYRRLEEPVASLKLETHTFPEDRLMALFTLGFVSPRNLALKKCFNEHVLFVNNIRTYTILRS